MRSDGYVEGQIEHSNSWSTWTETFVEKNSETRLSAAGDVNVEVAATGDAASGGYSGIVYAGVAATERGKVDIDAGSDVNIKVANQTTGGNLEAGGMYGIASGFGLGVNDLPSKTDFPVTDETSSSDRNGDGYDDYAYEQYMNAIADKYYNDKREAWNEETGQYEPQNNASAVNVSSGGDVKVTVDLGSGTYTGAASGIRAVMGDVNVTADGDITVNTTLDGVHRGNEENVLSALEMGEGRVTLKADGDVTLSVRGDGDNLAVVNYEPGATYAYHGGVNPTHISGKNVVFKGEAGKNGNADNSIAGIDGTNSNFKKEAFTVSAEEKFTMDISAQHNGGTTEVSGINIGMSDLYPSYYRHFLSLAVDAPEFEIKASVTGDISQGDSKAAGIAIGTGGGLGIFSYDSLDEFSGTGHGLDWGREAKPVESLDINVSGARHNVGIEVVSEGSRWEDKAWADIRARELDITVSGGTASGDSSSYGLHAVSNGDEWDTDRAKINIESEDLTITVDNPQHSVGISADGNGSMVSIGTIREYGSEGSYAPNAISVTINCTINNGTELLNGIAIEALNGGYVSITGNRNASEDRPEYNDTITVNGDIVARNTLDENGSYSRESQILFDTGYGNDRVDINGDVSIGKGAQFTVDLGSGNDYFSLGGGITLEKGGSFTLDAGAGDDVIILNGKVDLDFRQGDDGSVHSGGNFRLSGGDGNDVLVLHAPDAATFNEWYKDWLQQEGLLENLQIENIIVQGVDNPADIGWLADLVSQAGNINFDVLGTDVSLSMVNDLSVFSDGSFALDGVGSNDMLHVRFGDADVLSGLGTAMNNGGVKGLEHLLLESTGESIDGLLNNGTLSFLLDSTSAGKANEGANVLLKLDSSQIHNLENAGWSASGSSSQINGIEYTVYENAEEQQLFIQLTTATV